MRRYVSRRSPTVPSTRRSPRPHFSDEPPAEQPVQTRHLLDGLAEGLHGPARELARLHHGGDLRSIRVISAGKFEVDTTPRPGD
jgi:hypothetical protein